VSSRARTFTGKEMIASVTWSPRAAGNSAPSTSMWGAISVATENTAVSTKPTPAAAP
jgi:hypothetical protein